MRTVAGEIESSDGTKLSAGAASVSEAPDCAGSTTAGLGWHSCFVITGPDAGGVSWGTEFAQPIGSCPSPFPPSSARAPAAQVLPHKKFLRSSGRFRPGDASGGGG